MPKTKQESLPGTQSKRVVAVEKAAHIYAEARDERMEKGREEKVAYDALSLAMQKNKVSEYHRNGLIITLEKNREVQGEGRGRQLR